MISDVQSNVFTIADVAVFNGRSGTLTTHTHSWSHCADRERTSIYAANSKVMKSILIEHILIKRILSLNAFQVKWMCAKLT